MTTPEIRNGDTNLPVYNSIDLREILEAILRANETLIAQNRTFQKFLDGDIPSRSSWHAGGARGHATDTNAPTSYADQRNTLETNSDAWEGIMGASAAESEEFMDAFYHWARPATVGEVLNERRRWTSWSYAAAFPALSKFLKRATPKHRCRCQVWMDDLYGLQVEPRSFSYAESKKSINALWDEIKERAAFPSRGRELRSNAESVSVRLFRIADLSPLVLSAILGSTPQ